MALWIPGVGWKAWRHDLRVPATSLLLVRLRGNYQDFGNGDLGESLRRRSDVDDVFWRVECPLKVRVGSDDARKFSGSRDLIDATLTSADRQEPVPVPHYARSTQAAGTFSFCFFVPIVGFVHRYRHIQHLPLFSSGTLSHARPTKSTAGIGPACPRHVAV